jgi:hypothetical protein
VIETEIVDVIDDDNPDISRENGNQSSVQEL